MGGYNRHRAGSKTAVLLRLQGMADPAIADYIRDLRRRYGKHAMPPEEVRRTLDKSMGTRTLTELLYETREES